MAVTSTALPTLYEYYTAGGITAGLSDDQTYFTLNEKNITIYSGAFHYFRVPRAYWRDRLRKMRAAGLNTVETYVPWNLHEYQSGVYDFGNGGSDMEDFLHIEEFLKTAQEEDLFALVRPGPYICAEWEFGGLPSWILRYTTSVRSSKSPTFLTYVKRYFSILLPILTLLQFQNDGPIIGFQVENEYAGTEQSDLEYLLELKQMFLDNGIKELLYTSDAPRANGIGSIPGVLQTANYNLNPPWQLNKLTSLQSNKPTMTMEFWTGWFDYWLETHHTVSTKQFSTLVEEILDYPSSINMYMFVGSTNFGFLNGANSFVDGTDNYGLQPATSSYDYDAPLTEYGNYTSKYTAVKDIIAARNKVATRLPDTPAHVTTTVYTTLRIEEQLPIVRVIDSYRPKIQSDDVIPMELLPINNNSGQSYGYVVYRKTDLDIPANAVIKIAGYVRDTVLVLINGILVSKPPTDESSLEGFGFWKAKDSTLTLTTSPLQSATLDLIVENFGRNNFGRLSQFVQFKGLTEPVYLNDEQLTGWQIVPLEFKKASNNNLVSLKSWQPPVKAAGASSLYRANLVITEDPQDTFVDMRDWNKGIVIVNGFVLGRYLFLGPQQSLYLPAPFLKKGDNEILVFEHYSPADLIKFSDTPIFGGPSH